MIKHKFYELKWKAHSSIIFLNWLPSSVNMSGEDMNEHINALNNLIDVRSSRILFVDATGFNADFGRYSAEDCQYINEQSSLKWIIYTSSSPWMKKLFRRIESGKTTVIEYTNRDKMLRIYYETEDSWPDQDSNKNHGSSYS